MTTTPEPARIEALREAWSAMMQKYAHAFGCWDRGYDPEVEAMRQAVAALTDRPTPAAVSEEQEEPRYLILKGGAYYRPNAEGYTRNRDEAGLYTLSEAISHSHPNGPDGPRDGIAYKLALAKEVATPQPIDMLLFCPMCGIQHIDEPDERTEGWDNPPHRSHLCHGCGCIWRPADVPTNGVVRLQTTGKADTWGESNSAALPVATPPVSDEVVRLREEVVTLRRDLEHMRCREALLKMDLADEPAYRFGWWNDMKKRGLSDEAAISAIEAARAAFSATPSKEMGK